MTSHHDELRVAPDPARAEQLRRRLHARLASGARDKPIVPIQQADPDDPEGHLIMLETEDRPTGDQLATPHRRSPGGWLLVAAAAVLVAVVGTLLVTAGGDDDDEIDTVMPVPTTPLTPHTSRNGEVTVSMPSTWDVLWRGALGVDTPDDTAYVWMGLLYSAEDVADDADSDPEGPASDGSDTIGLVDPVAYDAWCAAELEEGQPPDRGLGEGSSGPLLSGPADAAAIARELIADPNFETTAPVAARIGGVKALSMDVALAPDGAPCGVGVTDMARWVHSLWNEGLRQRLYLVDLPAGMSVQTVAITVQAPEERFEEFLAETAPIIESIEFHPN
jgi:hypothetical protein